MAAPSPNAIVYKLLVDIEIMIDADKEKKATKECYGRRLYDSFNFFHVFVILYKHCNN